MREIDQAECELDSKRYPALKHVLQNSHVTINGTFKFKHFNVYAQPSMNTNSLPAINDGMNALQIFSVSGKVLSNPFTGRE